MTEIIMDPLLSRRKFVAFGLYGSTVLLIPAVPLGCGNDEDATTRPRQEGRFLDTHQYETVKALTGIIVPEDVDPGAVSAGVVDYIDCLLGAFLVDPPRIYAAGPYSGRHGGENGFAIYLPLSRVKEIAWRNHIEGSKGIPEREFNGPVVGLQEIYSKGVEALDSLAHARFQGDFKALDPGEQKYVLDRVDAGFRDIVFEHTVEGMYAAPEYGGNADCVGWEYIHYEGDRQPVGYTRKQVEEPDEEYGASAFSEDEIDEAAGYLQRMLAPGSKRSSVGSSRSKL